MTPKKKTLYLANPYGFSAQQREGPLAALVAALEATGAEVWEPFARNNQIGRQAPAGPPASDRPTFATCATPTGCSRWSTAVLRTRG